MISFSHPPIEACCFAAVARKHVADIDFFEKKIQFRWQNKTETEWDTVNGKHLQCRRSPSQKKSSSRHFSWDFYLLWYQEIQCRISSFWLSLMFPVSYLSRRRDYQPWNTGYAGYAFTSLTLQVAICATGSDDPRELLAQVRIQDFGQPILNCNRSLFGGGDPSFLQANKAFLGENSPQFLHLKCKWASPLHQAYEMHGCSKTRSRLWSRILVWGQRLWSKMSYPGSSILVLLFIFAENCIWKKSISSDQGSSDTLPPPPHISIRPCSDLGEGRRSCRLVSGVHWCISTQQVRMSPG